ncbi:MAG: hypothetical protein ACK476_13190 [Fluviicola sp.]
MKKIFLLLILFTSLFSNAQVDSNKRSVFEISPITLVLNDGITYSSSFNGFRYLGKSFFCDFNIDYAILRGFDSRNKYFSKNENFLNYLNFQLSVGYKNKLKKSSLFRVESVDYFAGFQDLRYASSSNDYWILDSTSNGFKKLSGFDYTSLTAGIQFYSKYINGKDPIYNEQLLRFEYSFCVRGDIQTMLTNNNDVEKELIKSPYKLNRHGFKFSYKYTYPLNHRFGVFAKIQAFWSPTLKKYEPNYDFFVPRGGEKIFQLFCGFSLGLKF